MYLVTVEDEEGMWFDDPIAADTREDAERLSRMKWRKLQFGIARVLYKCEQVVVLDEVDGGSGE